MPYDLLQGWHRNEGDLKNEGGVSPSSFFLFLPACFIPFIDALLPPIKGLLFLCCNS